MASRRPRRPPLARLLGRRIAALRAEVGLTQETLAWEADLESKGYVSSIESGTKQPSLDVLRRLAKRLGVEVRDLFIFPDEGSVPEAMETIREGGVEVADRVLSVLRSRR